MNKLYLVIGIALIVLTILGYYFKIGYLDEKGWESSEDHPFWNVAIIWGSLFCIFLWIKKLHPSAHPILWILGGLPLGYGLYVAYMMGGF